MPSSSGVKPCKASRLPTLTPTRTADPTTITSPVTSKLPVRQSRLLKSSSVSTRSYQQCRPTSSPVVAKSQLPAANRSRSSTLPARVDARSCPTKPEPIAAYQQSPPTPATKPSRNISRKCPECHHALLLPPSIESLRQVYPQLVVNESINRSIYTCRNCAYLAATRRAMQNQFMWPNSANYLLKLDGERKAALKKLEVVQDEVDACIEAGTDDLDALAKRLQDAHDAAAKVQDIKEMATNQIRTGKRLAWVPFWAVWGKMEGQEGYVSEVPRARV